jgi:hypothetical protein
MPGGFFDFEENRWRRLRTTWLKLRMT